MPESPSSETAPESVSRVIPARLGARPSRSTLAVLPRVNAPVQFLRVALTGAAVAGILLLHGFHRPVLEPWEIASAQLLLMAAYWADVLWRQRIGRPPIPGQRLDFVDAVMGGLVLLGLGLDLLIAHQYAWLLVEAGIVWTFFAEVWRLYVAASQQLRRPGVLMPASFLFLIMCGTILIKLPVAAAPGRELSWLDALFTMTSAVCVTGLVVQDTARHFSPLGQTIIAVFIQLGGLGFIVFGSTVALMLGERFSARGAHDLSQMLQGEPVHRLRRFARFILLATLGAELLAAALMLPFWQSVDGEAMTIWRRLGLSLFHSVSAFCNAGFDITGESMVPYRYSFLAHGLIAPLIVLGGIGFPVLSNLIETATDSLRAARARRRGVPMRLGRMPRRLSLHTRLVLVTTLGLYLWGVLALVASQATFVSDFGEVPRLLADASFMSITARTAGFNSMPMDELQQAGWFGLITLMIVGGAPGGAAGGLKVTVLAVLLWSVIGTVRQRRETEVFRRTISDSVVRQAGTLALCYLVLIVSATFLLTLSEGATFGVILFEAVSAATTTGLSLGLTPELSPFGRVVVIVTMFLGRVGPLALFAALIFRGGAQRPYAYPHESVALG